MGTVTALKRRNYTLVLTFMLTANLTHPGSKSFRDCMKVPSWEAAKEAKAFLQQKCVCYSVEFHPVMRNWGWGRNKMSE